MRRGARLACALAALLAGAARAEPELAFVHAEANVGGASGGHIGLRLGDVVYHYQAHDERLVLERDAWPAFRFRYGVLENRPLHSAGIPLQAAELRRARDGFADAYLAGRRAQDALAEARADVELLEALSGARREIVSRGAGLLDPAQPEAPEGVALRAQVAPRLGTDVLELVLARAEAGLGESPLAPGAPRRLREALGLHAALVALRDAHALDAAVQLAPAGPPLAPGERAALEALAAAQADAVVELLRSPRPDRGQALFTALARHHAAQRSLASGRLVLVDPHPDAAPVLDRRAVAAQREELAAAADVLGEDLAAARAALAAGPPDERALQRLELLAARREEYARGAREGSPVREPRGELAPQRGRALAPRAGAADAAALRAALAAARAELLALERRTAAAHRYDLFRANCATELVRTLVAVLGGSERAARVLGGRLEPGEGLGFVPFALFDQVTGRLAVARVERLPSWRERAVAELRAEGSAWTAAREANTLTSRVYRRRDADGSFLLFSDGAPLARPLQGALNLGWAGADAALGIATAPFDRGRRLARAARGALFSLPELVFVNIRKGTFDAAGLRRASREEAPAR